MKVIRVVGLLAGLLAASGVMADMPRYHAYHDWHTIDFRQQRQQRRIEHGIDAGLLTHREIKKLQKQQRKIARLEHRFKRDGWLNSHEAEVLQRKLDKASRTIHAFKHNHRVQDEGYGHRHSAPYPYLAESRANGWTDGYSRRYSSSGYREQW